MAEDVESLAKDLGYKNRRRSTYTAPAMAGLFGLFAGINAIGAAGCFLAFLSTKEGAWYSSVWILWALAFVVGFVVNFAIAQIINCIGRSAHYTEEIADFLHDYRPPQSEGYILNAILEELRALNRKTVLPQEESEPTPPATETEVKPPPRIEIPCPVCQKTFSILDLPDKTEHTCPHCGQIVELAEEPAH
jgi:hypothetical protein